MIDAEKLSKIVTLDKGNHDPASGQMCAMEAAAWIAGEEWSDHPQCVSPVIAAFLRLWNDALPDATRTTLLRPLLPLVIWTRTTDADEETRAWMAVDWLVRVNAPVWFDLTPALASHAFALRSLPPVTAGTASAVCSVALSARTAAWDATLAAALDATRDATRDAAWDAALAAALDAAGVAAWDAAWDAALVATLDATRDAAGDGLAPTVAALQASAVQLVRQMCAVGRDTIPEMTP
jgi:hypothetical protein